MNLGRRLALGYNATTAEPVRGHGVAVREMSARAR